MEKSCGNFACSVQRNIESMSLIVKLDQTASVPTSKLLNNLFQQIFKSGFRNLSWILGHVLKLCIDLNLSFYIANNNS